MIPKMKIIPEGNKISPFIFFFISMISSLTFGQNAIDYFPSENGCVWKYDIYTLDNSNNIIAATKSERYDSLIGQGNYKGKNASICLTNWDLYNNVIGTGYNDSVTYSFAGSIASEYNYLFTPPYKGEFVDLIVSEIRDKILGWFDLYQFDKPVNTEYEVLRYDTSIIYHVLGQNVNADITTRIVGKREADETIETTIGTFPSKKFTYNIVIDLIIYWMGNSYHVPFANFPVTHWITDNRWIIKEYRPTVTTSDLSQIQINPVTVPGLSRIITGFSYPKPVIPVLLTPQNNSTNNSINPSLSWNESNYANHYHIQVATDSGFKNIVYEDSTINNTLVTINNLAYGTNYYWHLKAKNSNNVSEWSDFWKFTTKLENFLTVSKSNLNIASIEGSTSTVNVSSNVNWTAISNQTWLNISPESGTGNGSITLAAAVNPTTTERTAIITVSGEGVASKSITVTQAPGAVTLVVSTNTLNIAAVESSTSSFGITSNTTWNVSSDQSWLSFNHSTGTGNGSITITSQANLTITQRTATVTVSATGAATKTITVTQAAGNATLSLSTTLLNIAANEGSTATFTITSNTNWTVSADQSWISANHSTGTGNSSITLTAEKNPNIEKRTAAISVMASGVTTKTVTLTQESGSAVLTLSTNSISLEPTEESFATVEIASNTSWNATYSTSWFNLTPSSGTGNSSITITAKINNTTEERSDTITFTTTEGTTRLLSIIQKAGAATLSVSEIALNVEAIANSSTTFEISSNTSWTVTSDQNWLTANPGSGTGNGVVVLTAYANTSGKARTAIVTIEANNAVSKTITVTQGVITGLEIRSNQDVVVYPNPFTEGFYVNSTSDKMNVSLFDMRGVRILSEVVSKNGFVPASNLKNGIYLVNVIASGNSIQKTVIKK